MRIEWKKKFVQMMILLAGVCVLSLTALGGKRYEAGEENWRDVQTDEKEQQELFQASTVLGSCVRIQAQGHFGSGSIYNNRLIPSPSGG